MHRNESISLNLSKEIQSMTMINVKIFSFRYYAYMKFPTKIFTSSESSISNKEQMNNHLVFISYPCFVLIKFIIFLKISLVLCQAIRIYIHRFC